MAGVAQRRRTAESARADRHLKPIAVEGCSVRSFNVHGTLHQDRPFGDQAHTSRRVLSTHDDHFRHRQWFGRPA